MFHPFSGLSKLSHILKTRYPFLQDIVERAYSEFGVNWAIEFDDLLGRMFPDDSSLNVAIDGYVRFTLEALKLQAKFDASGKYINKLYAEAANEVYHNRSYMLGLYLPGILLSHFLWLHHYRHSTFFVGNFLSEMKRQHATHFADVGIGTGYYSRMILVGLPTARGHGFDISSHSREYSLLHLDRFGVADRFNIELRDVVTSTPENLTDWLVCIEVLEHLEDPQTFLRALRRMLRPNGKAFITAALNAPNADHIYLYRTPAEVLDQLRAAGFTPKQYHSSFAYAPRKLGLPVPEISAFILT